MMYYITFEVQYVEVVSFEILLKTKLKIASVVKSQMPGAAGQ